MNFPDRKVFCDTSFFFASLVPEDANYERAGDILVFCKENALTFCTTWDVISETVTLLRYRGTTGWPCSSWTPSNRHSSSSAMTIPCARRRRRWKFGRDKRLSYCDAVSYVVVASILGNIPSFSFDKDFRALGLTVYPS